MLNFNRTLLVYVLLICIGMRSSSLFQPWKASVLGTLPISLIPSQADQMFFELHFLWTYCEMKIFCLFLDFLSYKLISFMIFLNYKRQLYQLFYFKTSLFSFLPFNKTHLFISHQLICKQCHTFYGFVTSTPHLEVQNLVFLVTTISRVSGSLLLRPQLQCRSHLGNTDRIRACLFRCFCDCCGRKEKVVTCLSGIEVNHLAPI